MESRERIFCIAAVFAIIALVSGYPGYQLKIPNGGSVPDTCYNMSRKVPNYSAVGHYKESASQRNPFGLDFKKYGATWSRELCMLDSDKDDRTNGEELGDPNCLWSSQADDALLQPAVSHPGIPEVIFTHPNGETQWFPAPQIRQAACGPRPFWLGNSGK